MKILRILRQKATLFTVLALTFFASQTAFAYDTDKLSTVGLTVYGNFQLIDTLPVLKPGVGGGMYWDYRFNDRFSFQTEAFAITQKGKGVSSGEDSVEFFGLPITTIKLYVLERKYRFDPYVGAGIGLYWLNEGSLQNDTGGVGLGTQIEVATDYLLDDSLTLTTGAAYRSIGLITDLEGTSNASTYMTLTLFLRAGYRF